jgi:hypothetical protein
LPIKKVPVLIFRGKEEARGGGEGVITMKTEHGFQGSSQDQYKTRILIL